MGGYPALFACAETGEALGSAERRSGSAEYWSNAEGSGLKSCAAGLAVVMGRLVAHGVEA